jgi:large subunit ribosomal protein L9
MRSLGQLTAQSRNREERVKREASALAERLAAVQISLKRRASQEEAPGPADAAASAASAEESPAPAAGPARLFGSVTAQDLSEALATQGLAVERKQILLTEPIKTLGVHRVPVRLHAEVVTELTVTVEREN